ncbi:uncharacterized protein LOC104582232 [Brachypodium distachyon]|uniref:uncharacterized protein LOC104582232 n=1 Tax=Brachypodium distachyon TaxID=15368 RepID=UPI00052FF523|nr:uncharacterized protein LOC104582232 [Brachypodium distachyon]|eukprot:XP_010229928.1 uncharacterized protein LOC104582232 [Brachypodium distachyon]
MDPKLHQEWTSFEVQEARSLIARLSINMIDSYDADEKNKVHNHIVDALHGLFPWKTNEQVTDFYVTLYAEMHMMQGQEDSHAGGGGMHTACALPNHVNGSFGVPEEESGCANGAQGVCAMGDLAANSVFMVPEEEGEENVDGNVLVFGSPCEETNIMPTEASLTVEEQEVEVLENNFSSDQQVTAPKPVVGPWGKEEQRLFVLGLRAFGRGDWKNISKYFVTTRTPVQVSSHAQKFFRRLKNRALSNTQRHSINDDVDPYYANTLTSESGSGAGQALTFTGLIHDPSIGLEAPTSSFVTLDNIAQLLYSQQVVQQPLWSEQQMMGSGAATMDGVGNFEPPCRQGSTYLPPRNG